MADDTSAIEQEIPEDQEECTNYKPPPEKSLKEIVAADEGDESLRKYKEALLGQATKDIIIVDPSTPKHVLVRKLALIVEGRPDIELDLSGDLETLKKKTFVIKEGIQYRIRIDFYVQREIVTGLKYVQKIFRHGIQCDSISNMVGSYAPKKEIQSYTTPLEDMPSGMLARGNYTVKSLFTDDDKSEHLKWEWSFEIKKEWND
ncbi:rho GDP-dissociation inhibitor 1-like [Centruroides sculpturatus]|uniref:rho GDP-dissociation inhibitor 1-like n=1 Tax=Centruroides sculpturatus TaxID=218467 RepID=UPI000C6E1C80|nr:rho GDP-dissociation inhibitor 1-like [Centruroides sculpturatus]